MKSPSLLIALTHLALSQARALPPRVGLNTTTTLIATEYGSVFDAPVTIGGQTFHLLVDTGSSDTYVMRSDYTCINQTSGQTLPRAECNYSNRTYTPSPRYQEVKDTMFGIEYGAGIASGVMAYEDVALNSVTARNQQIAVANTSTPMGDGISSGLLGLAYPSLSSAHPANHTDNATYWFDRRVYTPLVQTLAAQSQINPFFSLALAHTPQNASVSFGGYLSLGDLPPVPHAEFTTVPVEVTKALPLNFTSNQHTLSYWTTTIKSAVWGKHNHTLTHSKQPFQAFIDSGNPASILPSAIVDPINALFDPPATYIPDKKVFVVDCAAKAPSFGLEIGTQVFFHQGRDLIYQTAEGACVTAFFRAEEVGVQGVSVNILGAAFLKNVVSVFDFGRNEMRFAGRLD
ncbi:aspartic peptidase domain-containing protein [Aspergillus avenaceus]|uniref:Aspartic peptidase domain-containing protein n=1 Tax=Aspergillus avenaceus TaxID=36643 RepID=A0A5N6TXU1_ASPAV|nr:aspartic peptidase domain-containing protein [Aspergillus avenaceus]